MTTRLQVLSTMILVTMILVVLTLPLRAADSNVPAPAQVESIVDEEIEPADDIEEQTSEKPAPVADNLRARDIGDAFKNFQPSEEISADNAVTFPVDI